MDPSTRRSDSLTAATLARCSVCGGGLPEVSVRMRDPFCSRACSEEHHGTGTRASRDRASRQRLAQQLEEGTDAASLELRRVTVDDRSLLIAEGRYAEEFVRAFAAYLIAHKEPVTTPTVTWFSYRASGPTMRMFDDDESWQMTAADGELPVSRAPFPPNRDQP